MMAAGLSLMQGVEKSIRLATRALEEVRAMAGRAATPGPPGPPGQLPMVEPWVDRVYYQRSVVTYDGRLYQAKQDTGRKPPHDDWLCIVAAKDGENGRSLRIRGTYSADLDYREHDVVMVNNSSFVAKRDNPGVCPGEDWQLLAGQGKPGKPGLSVKGDRGPAGKLLALEIDENAVLTAVNGDGSRVSCDLYDLLRRLER